jgi:pilus assembly protein CpaE
LDLDLQFGTVATYLDIERPEAVYDTLTDTASLDDEGLANALTAFGDCLHVLTAPREMLPLDLIEPGDVSRLIELAQRQFDFVVIDMPPAILQWSETVLRQAHIYLATLGTDMRSAQNTLRFRRALQAEELPVDKLRFVINRAPKFTDLAGKSRIRRMAETLGISLDVLLPDGGNPVAQSTDHGLPLGKCAPKNPLRKEIAKLANSILQVVQKEG